MIRLIAFDLDGTLLDTLDDLTNAVNYGLSSFGYEQKDKEYVRKAIGNGVRILISRCLPNGKENKDYPKVLEAFTDHYHKHFNDNTKPYKGVMETLRKLKEQNYLLAVITNKLDLIAKDLISHQFPNIFDEILGDTPNLNNKPSKDMLEKVMSDLNIKKNETLYVGDTNVDYEFASNAGVKCVLVTYGYRTKKEMSKYNILCNKIDNLNAINYSLEEISR